MGKISPGLACSLELSFSVFARTVQPVETAEAHTHTHKMSNLLPVQQKSGTVRVDLLESVIRPKKPKEFLLTITTCQSEQMPFPSHQTL